VLQKENEWKDKVNQIEKDYKLKLDTLKKEVEQATSDKQLISKSYESQLQMMSEHIVEMQ
jgi:phage host-nuclease inhibitor protein Gam